MIWGCGLHGIFMSLRMIVETDRRFRPLLITGVYLFIFLFQLYFAAVYLHDLVVIVVFRNTKTRSFSLVRSL